MSLMVFMVQRAVKRMMTPPSHPPSAPAAPRPSGTSSVPPSPRPITIRDTIWQGMSEADLLAAYGAPASRSSRPTGGEVWTYSLAEQGMIVTLENGKVLSWID